MTLTRLNTKKVTRTLIWALLLIGIGGLLYLSVLRKRSAEVSTVQFDIRAGENGVLIQEKELKKLVVKIVGFKPERKSIRKINSMKLERALEEDPRIKNAEVYFDSKNRLHVQVEPREVILRVSDAAGHQYFLDENGQKVPVMPGGAVRVPLANGKIEAYTEGFADKPGSSSLKEVFLLIKYINKDPFLQALIEQIYVEESGDITFIPKVGKEKLVFGGSVQMEEKFGNLKIFYRDGLTKLGWNRYPILNLKYVNQVVLVDGKPSPVEYSRETALNTVTQ